MWLVSTRKLLEASRVCVCVSLMRVITQVNAELVDCSVEFILLREYLEDGSNQGTRVALAGEYRTSIILMVPTPSPACPGYLQHQDDMGCNLLYDE